MRAMRVLFVCANDFTVASEKQALAFARELVGEGHEVVISVAGDPATAEDEGAAHLPGLTVRRHRFAGPRPRAADVRAARGFAPDVIHAFSARISVIAMVRRMHEATGAPVVVHWEDDEWRIRDDDMDRSLPRRLARRARRLVARVDPGQGCFITPASIDWITRHAARFDALTPALAQHVSERTGRDCDVLLPITPLPEPGTADTRAPGGPDVPGHTVLWTGTVSPATAPDFRVAVEAVGVLQGRGLEISLVHAGTILARYDVEAWARDAGLRDGSLRRLGYVPSPSLPDLLRRASVLVQSGPPTEYNRLRLPSKLQAYLASGTPTITFAVGFGDLLADREEVLLTHTGDPAELADRIQEVLQDAELRERLRRGGPEAARRLFDPARNTRALLDLYRRAAGLPAAARA